MLAQLFPQEIWVFFVVFVRLAALLTLFPQVSRSFVAPQIRMIIALFFTFILTPVVAGYIPPLPGNIWDILLIVLAELLVGTLIGTMSRMALDSLTYAGTFIAFQIGLSNAAVFNPLQAQQSILPAVFLLLLGTNLVFAVNFHHLLFIVLVESYSMFIPGVWHEIGNFTQVIVDTFINSFTIGFKLAAPFYFLSLFVYVVMGIMGRLMPQFQVFIVVLPAQILVGIALLAMLLPSIMLIFLEYYRSVFDPFLPNL